jgi:hypothetical protein
VTADLLIVLALVLVPGLGAAFAFAAPGGISVEARVALAVGFGYAIVAGSALLLALAHVFHRSVYIAAIVVVTAALWTVVLRKRSREAHVAALQTQVRAAPLTTTLNLVFVLVIAGIWAFQSAVPNLGRRSAWRYWADGLEIASAGHVPPESLQWGEELPTTVSKVATNSLEAAVIFFNGPDPFSGMRAILLVAAVGLVAGLIALGRELGLGVFSALVPVLTVLLPREAPFGREMSHDLGSYTAENLGRMATVCALVAAIYALRAPTRLPLVFVGLLLALSALTHAIPTAIGCVLLAAYGLGVVLLDRHRLRPLLARGALLVGVIGITYVAVVGVTRGALGFETAASGSWEDFPAGIDPTLSFSRGEYTPFAPRHGAWVTPPQRLVAEYAKKTFALPGSAWSLGLIIALFGATVLLLWRRRGLVPIATMAWGWSAFMLVAAFFFSLRYETHVPGHFGLWRLFDYAVLLPALVIPALLAGVAMLLRRFRWTNVVAVTGVAAVVALVCALAAIRQEEPNRPARAGLRVISAVASVVPCDAVMVANARTAGSWQATTGRRALTEGRAPFLQADVLRRILTVLDGSTKFFEDPQANRDFLDRERVEYLVVVRPRVWFGWGETDRGPGAEDTERVAALPEVDPVFESEDVTIFAVSANTAPPAGTPPRRCPV